LLGLWRTPTSATQTWSATRRGQQSWLSLLTTSWAGMPSTGPINSLSCPQMTCPMSGQRGKPREPASSPHRRKSQSRLARWPGLRTTSAESLTLLLAVRLNRRTAGHTTARSWGTYATCSSQVGGGRSVSCPTPARTTSSLGVLPEDSICVY